MSEFAEAANTQPAQLCPQSGDFRAGHRTFHPLLQSPAYVSGSQDDPAWALPSRVPPPTEREQLGVDRRPRARAFEGPGVLLTQGGMRDQALILVRCTSAGLRLARPGPPGQCVLPARRSRSCMASGLSQQVGFRAILAERDPVPILDRPAWYSRQKT